MTPTGDIASRNLVLFVRALRSSGFSVTTTTTQHLVAAARIVGLHARSDVREAFRSVVVTTHRQSRRFDEIFDRFFTGDVVTVLDQGVDRPVERKPVQRVPRIGAVGDAETEDAEDHDSVADVVGGSSEERLMDIDFSDLSDDEAAAVAALLADMAWSPSYVASRRWQTASRGEVPDLRRTLRLLVGPRGDLMPLAFSQRRPKQRPVVVIADVSGSMEPYTEMLLHFVHGAQYKFSNVEAFVFATRLTRVTRQLRTRNATDALSRVAARVPDWSGGTRIGEALGVFNRDWSRRISGGPVVLIVSDGWDTGEPDRLAVEMRRLRRSVHRVIWLNPLAGRDGFTPEARGMAAALPYVDELMAAGTARNLVDLIDLLQASTAPRTASRKRSVATS